MSEGTQRADRQSGFWRLRDEKITLILSETLVSESYADKAPCAAGIAPLKQRSSYRELYVLCGYIPFFHITS